MVVDKRGENEKMEAGPSTTKRPLLARRLRFSGSYPGARGVRRRLRK